jgi:4-hydroxy-tetrahydrodipicolinate reductase
MKASEDSLTLPGGKGKVPFSTDLSQIIKNTKPDVVIDFSVAKAAVPAAKIAIGLGVNMVIGTTGLSDGDIKQIEQLSKDKKVGVFVAPNFALGAVIMMHLAQIAGKHLDYAEIIELHHEKKVDAPSGTALMTAKQMVNARGKPFLKPETSGERQPSRGLEVQGISIHSVRLPGFQAHQEVLLGGLGQTLSIRHDMMSREGYMPAVIIAVKQVVNRKGFTYGLDNLLGL